MTHHRLVTVKGNSRVEISDYTGYHSETAVYRQHNLDKADRTVLASFVYQSHDEGKTWHNRSVFDSSFYKDEARG